VKNRKSKAFGLVTSMPETLSHGGQITADRRTAFTLSRRWGYAAAAIVFAAAALHARGFHARLPAQDESIYLGNGAMLVEHGALHLFSENPLPTLVNGLLYLPFSPHAIRLEAVSTIRQWFTFAAMLAAAGWATNRCCGSLGAACAVTIIAVSRASLIVAGNSSDALYGTSILLCWGVVLSIVAPDGALSDRSRKYFLLGLCLSAAAMARNDGLVAGVMIFSLFAVLFWRSALRWETALRPLGGLLAGFVLPILLWVIVSGLQTKVWTLGSGDRAYLAFRQGYYKLYFDRFEPTPGMRLFENVFGSEQSNHHSVMLAIAHHPRAFLLRISRVPAELLRCTADAFGTFAAVGVLAGLGVGLREFVRRRQLSRLACMAALLSPMAVYFVTFFRPGYLAMVFPLLIVASVSGICLCWTADGPKSPARRSKVPTLVLAFLFASNAFHFVRSTRARESDQRPDAPYRNWVLALARTVPPGQTVLAVDPSQLIYAGLGYVHDPPRMLNRADEPGALAANMDANHLEWVIADADMLDVAPHLAASIEQGGLFQVVIRDNEYHACLYRRMP
jgi:hypothetical protein